MWRTFFLLLVNIGIIIKNNIQIRKSVIYLIPICFAGYIKAIKVNKISNKVFSFMKPKCVGYLTKKSEMVSYAVMYLEKHLCLGFKDQPEYCCLANQLNYRYDNLLI